MTLGANQIAAYAADLFDLEAEIEALQDGKRDLYAIIREEHGRIQADAIKNAIRLVRMKPERREQVEAIDTETARVLAIVEMGGRGAPAPAREIIEQFDAETGEITEPAGQTVEQGGEGGAALPADESTAALMEVPVGSETPTADDPGDRGGAAGTQAPPVDTNSAAADQSGNVDGSAGRSHSALAMSTESPASVPLDTQSQEPTAEAAGDLRDSPAGAEGDADRPLNSAAANALKMRPLCLHADDLTKCGGYGRVTCHDCLKAHADAEGISA